MHASVGNEAGDVSLRDSPRRGGIDVAMFGDDGESEPVQKREKFCAVVDCGFGSTGCRGNEKVQTGTDAGPDGGVLGAGGVVDGRARGKGHGGEVMLRGTD